MGRPAHVERAIQEGDTASLKSFGSLGGKRAADKRDMLRDFDAYLEEGRHARGESELARLEQAGELIIPLDTYH